MTYDPDSRDEFDKYDGEDPCVTVKVTLPEGSTWQTGKQYKVLVDISLKNTASYEDVNGQTADLFTKYEDLTVTLTAPEGMVLVAGDTEYTGTFTVPVSELFTVDSDGSIKAPDSGTKEGTYTLYAYLTGNGTLPAGTSYDAITVTASASTHVCQPIKGGSSLSDDELKKDFTPAIINKTEVSSALQDKSDTWAVNKSTDANQVVWNKAGGTVTVTYTIEAGHPGTSAGAVRSERDYYVNFGVLDLTTASITDTIPAVEGRKTDSLYPTGVTVNGEAVTLDENHSFTIPADQLTKLTLTDAEKATYHIDSDTVYGYSKFTVVLTYPEDEFVYPLIETAQAHTFENSAKLSYQPVGAQEKIDTSDTATVSRTLQASGGDVQIAQYIYLSGDTAAATAYDQTYVVWFGNVSYTLYYKDQLDQEALAQGSIQPAEGVTSLWSKTLSLNNGSDHTIRTGRGGEGDAANQIPVGKIIIVPNYPTSDEVTPAAAGNTTDNVPSYYEVTVEEGKLNTATAVYMRYLSGAFVHLTKQFNSVSGTGESIGDKKATFSLTELTGEGGDVKAGGHSYTATTDNSGAFTQPVYAAASGTWYRVTETGTADGYLTSATSYDILVTPGATTNVNANDPVVNYPNKARIVLSGALSDLWEGVTYDTTDGVTAVSGKEYTFTITGSDGSSYTATLENSNTCVVDLPRYDAAGSLITYTITNDGFPADENGVPFGYIDQKGNKDDKLDVDVTFADDTSLVYNLRYYYQRYAHITVTKTVADSTVETPASVEGWEFKLTRSVNGVEDTSFVITATTDANGKISAWLNGENTELLPVSDGTNYYTYTLTEVLTDDQQAEWAVSGAGDVAMSATVHNKAYAVTNTRRRGIITITKVGSDTTTDEDGRVIKPLLKGVGFSFVVVDGQGEDDGYSYDIKHDENGNEMWLNQAGDGFVSSEGAAGIFYTGEDGTVTVTPPSGYYYRAVEEVELDYYKIGDDTGYYNVGFLNDNGSLTHEWVNYPTNKITITKTVVDQYGNAVETSGTATFDIYMAEKYQSLEKVSGDEGVTVGTDGAVTFQSDRWAPYSYFYLRETDADGGYWLRVDQQNEAGGEILNDTITIDGVEYIGPFWPD